MFEKVVISVGMLSDLLVSFVVVWGCDVFVVFYIFIYLEY